MTVANPRNSALRLTGDVVNLLKQFEGFRSCPYWDKYGKKWTVGYGHTRTAETLHKKNVCLTEPQALALKMQDLAEFEACVKKWVTVPITANMLNALTAFAYNIGCNNFRRSSVLKFINAGQYKQAAETLLQFNRSGGKILAGLTSRRTAERNLYMTNTNGLADPLTTNSDAMHRRAAIEAYGLADMSIDQAGIDLIKKQEGFRSKAYWDVNHYSIGYGTPAKSKDEVIDKAEAERRLRNHVDSAEACVNRNIDPTVTQGQFNAMVSVAYNMGCGNFGKTGLKKAINNGDLDTAKHWFTNKSICCNAGGEYHTGVANRRRAEQSMFAGGAVTAITNNVISTTAWVTDNLKTNSTWQIAALCVATGITAAIIAKKKQLI